MSKASTLMDGTVEQSSFTWSGADYKDEKIYFPVLGIVLSVYPSDHYSNRSAVREHDQRGSRWEAEVFIINDGKDNQWIIPNAVITPPGPTGADNYNEELPTPCSQMLDGSRLDLSMTGVDPEKLDGDWCLVQFIGGDLRQAVITSWFPHPYNFSDTATSGITGDFLPQGNRRIFKRYAGTKVVVTSQGNIHVDTSESNSTFVGRPGGATRERSEDGGHIAVDVKDSQHLEVNFNAPVEDPSGSPELPQTNPPTTGVSTSERSEDNSKFYMDKNFIRAVAGQMVEMLSKTGESFVRVTETGDVEAGGPGLVVLGDPQTTIGLSDGAVTARGTDTFTGATYGALGNASDKVIVEK